jgi:hypothetical protein
MGERIEAGHDPSLVDGTWAAGFGGPGHPWRLASERLLRMFLGPAWGIWLMIALLPPSYGSLNDYPEHEELPRA